VDAVEIPGGTPFQDVTELLGPPDRFAGSARVSASWRYDDVPEPGTHLEISFTDGVVTGSHSGLDHGRAAPPEHGWARELVPAHVAHVESVHPDQRLLDRPGWARLTDPEMLAFVGSVDGPPPDGTLSWSARRVGELDVIVGMVAVTGAAEIRERLAHGYFVELASLIDGFGITPGRRDLAHWVFGATSPEDTVAHLAYLPTAKEITALAPTDLLTPADRAITPLAPGSGEPGPPPPSWGEQPAGDEPATARRGWQRWRR
jgi:hypothetical protein